MAFGKELERVVRAISTFEAFSPAILKKAGVHNGRLEDAFNSGKIVPKDFKNYAKSLGANRRNTVDLAAVGIRAHPPGSVSYRYRIQVNGPTVLAVEKVFDWRVVSVIFHNPIDVAGTEEKLRAAGHATVLAVPPRGKKVTIDGISALEIWSNELKVPNAEALRKVWPHIKLATTGRAQRRR